MNDKNELLRYASDAIGSLKAAWAVAIATAGSSGALLFNVIEGGLALCGTAMAITLAYWAMRKHKSGILRDNAARARDEYELHVLRTREEDRLMEVEHREERGEPIRRACDHDGQTNESPN